MASASVPALSFCLPQSINYRTLYWGTKQALLSLACLRSMVLFTTIRNKVSQGPSQQTEDWWGQMMLRPSNVPPERLYLCRWDKTHGDGQSSLWIWLYSESSGRGISVYVYEDISRKIFLSRGGLSMSGDYVFTWIVFQGSINRETEMSVFPAPFSQWWKLGKFPMPATLNYATHSPPGWVVPFLFLNCFLLIKNIQEYCCYLQTK